MAGTLFIVSTPIGNLEDITLRALRVLREVDLIAAEDTRRTGRLLTRHGISTSTISFHEHNSRGRIPQLVQRLVNGHSIAVVSDAGTPSVSDPGLDLVHACVTAGIRIDPLPGPSAPLAAVVVSGFPVIPLTIFGFAPSRSKDRIGWLEVLARVEMTTTFFEAPHRIADTLEVAGPILVERQIVVAREVTKVHQEFLRGTAKSLAPLLQDTKGEITVVVAPPPKLPVEKVAHGDEEVAHQFGLMANSGHGSRGEVVAATAKRLGMSRRDVYAALERTKSSGE
jgi:16S rRNA (cytidine1402-2'-O)-methyltransferase